MGSLPYRSPLASRWEDLLGSYRLLFFFAAGCRTAVEPATYSWRQLMGVGAIAGIGFTMSSFIAGQALPFVSDHVAAKAAVFVASALSAVIGVGVLWGTKSTPTRWTGRQGSMA